MTAPRRNSLIPCPAPATVVDLQAERSYPSVSLLVSTTPGDRMTVEDRRVVDRLVGQACSRLRTDPSPDAAAVLREFTTVMEQACLEPTGRALAVFANRSVSRIVHLPVGVETRVIIDPTFATRDLVRALHRTPRHVVLVLNRREARLFDGVGDSLTPPVRSRFPLVAAEHPDRAAGGSDLSFFRQVDRALGTYLRLHPAPLVLVGTERTVAAFRQLSANTSRLAGAVHESFVSAPPDELVPRIREVLDGYLASRREEALALIERRRSRGKVVDGIAAAWLAARRARPEMLAVEDTCVFPARVSPDGDFLIPAVDADHPEVIDDIVDELIELVLQRGGWITFVDDGALADQGGVALVLR